MGNRSSRQRQPSTTQGDGATSGGTQHQQGSQQSPIPTVQYSPYPPSQVYRPQAGYYPGQQQQQQHQGYMNNGQYYGGWRPSQGQVQPYMHVMVPMQQQQQQPPQGAQQQQQHPPRHGGPPAQQLTPPYGRTPPPAPAPAQELTQTATIRNAVNLKKNTLHVEPVPGEPQKLAISFTFDASAPCAVTTFVMATEAPANGCSLTTAQQQPAPVVHFEKGLGLRFPGSAAGAAAQHCIDLSLYEEEALQQHERDTYPLVVRLETVTEKGLKEGHSLQELVPGAEQKGWVQSQTTYAQLHKEEDGMWVVRVMKQKIWVEGVSYELQEIYGLEQSSSTRAADTAEDNEERLCVICLVNDRDTTVLPCRHMCMCHECAQELRKQTSKCPICRNHVESLLHIRMHKGHKMPSAATPMTEQQVAEAKAGNAVAEHPTHTAASGAAADDSVAHV